MQWEYQVGPSVGIEAGDHIWCSRYILEVNHPCLPLSRYSPQQMVKYETLKSSNFFHFKTWPTNRCKFASLIKLALERNMNGIVGSFFMLICVCSCLLVGCMWTHVFFLSGQRITEQAGVVLSLDPKPIEVATLNCYVLLVLEIYGLNGLLWSIFIDRVTGMELDATPITGTWMHSLSLNMIIEEQWDGYYVAAIINDGSFLLQYEEHERGRRLWSHKEGNSESVSSPQGAYQCLWGRKWEKVDRKARNSKYQHLFLGMYEDLLHLLYWTILFGACLKILLKIPTAGSG